MSEQDARGLREATAALRRLFGFDSFRPPQRLIVEDMLGDRDVLAVLPTGGGKSVCFQVPALLAPGLTLVVTPLISLMQDQVEHARRRGLGALALHSGDAGGSTGDVRQQLATGVVKLLYVSAEKLAGSSLRRLLAGVRVSRLAVDEAHCISEWGHDFRPAYRRIAAFSRTVGRPPCAAFTATATPATRRDIVRNLEFRLPSIRAWPVDRPNLRWQVARAVTGSAAAQLAIHALRRTPGAAIVYARTRREAARMAEAVRRHGMRAAAYHAGMEGATRARVQRSFLDSTLRVVCATTAFGMGIDHPHVRLVVHLGRPGSLEGYVQEAGRAGRDGQVARCLLIARPDDSMFHRTLLRDAWPAADLVRQVWRAMRPRTVVARAALRDTLGPGLSDADLDRALSFLGREGGVRRVERRPAAPEAWTRAPDALWPRLSAALRSGHQRARARIAAIGRYVETRACRRRVIARYFGDVPAPCSGCDRCGRVGA